MIEEASNNPAFATLWKPSKILLVPPIHCSRYETCYDGDELIQQCSYLMWGISKQDNGSDKMPWKRLCSDYIVSRAQQASKTISPVGIMHKNKRNKFNLLLHFFPIAYKL